MTSSLYCAPDQSLNAAIEEQSQRCLLDVMSITLTGMDLYSAHRVEGTPDSQAKESDEDIRLKGYSFTMDRNQPLKEK